MRLSEKCARFLTGTDGKSALMLVTARLKYVAESEWGSRRYLDVTLLEGVAAPDGGLMRLSEKCARFLDGNRHGDTSPIPPYP